MTPALVFSIPTARGLAYFQYVDRIKPHGALIRVLSGVFREAPFDVGQLAAGPERFWVFVPLGAMVRRGLISAVGHAEIPTEARGFPLMKLPAAAPSWEADEWWLWNGDKEWRTGRTDPLLKTASPRETWNDTLLAHRIASGWSPADDLLPPAPSNSPLTITRAEG
jgi:hypothetical protein